MLRSPTVRIIWLPLKKTLDKVTVRLWILTPCPCLTCLKNWHVPFNFVLVFREVCQIYFLFLFVIGELKHISKLRPWWVVFLAYYIREPYIINWVDMEIGHCKVSLNLKFKALALRHPLRRRANARNVYFGNTVRQQNHSFFWNLSASNLEWARSRPKVFVFFFFFFWEKLQSYRF